MDTDIETNSLSPDGEKRTRNEAMIEGNLDEMSLPEVIQFIQENAETS